MRQRFTDEKLAAYLAIIFASLLVLLPFHAFLTSWAGNNLGHLDAIRIWKEIILAVTAPVVIYLGWKQKNTRQFLKSSWVVRLFIFYVLLHLALGAWALSNHAVNVNAFIYSLLVNLRFIYFFIASYIVASYVPWLKERSPRLLILPALVVLVVGFIQEIAFPHNLLGYFYGNAMLAYQTIDSTSNLERVQSTLRGANPLGAYLILALTAFAVFIRRRYLRWLALAGGLLLLFYSYSRSAWLGTIIALWLLAWWTAFKTHHKVWLVSSILIGVILVGSIFYLFKSAPVAQDTLFHTSSVSKSPISSNQARRVALKSGLNDIVSQPLGGGPGTAGPASFRNTPHGTRIAENYYLQLGQEVGIIGMVTFIIINLIVARGLWLRRHEMLSHVLLASLAGISFVNLLSHAWTDDTLSLLWWGLAGIALAVVPTARLRANDKISKT